jgi:hypothetical protein
MVCKTSGISGVTEAILINASVRPIGLAFGNAKEIIAELRVGGRHCG